MNNEIIESYNLPSNSEYLEIKGVCCFGSNEDGPSVGIGVMPHGHEPTGLTAFKHILENDDDENIGESLEHGLFKGFPVKW